MIWVSYSSAISGFGNNKEIYQDLYGYVQRCVSSSQNSTLRLSSDGTVVWQESWFRPWWDLYVY